MGRAAYRPRHTKLAIDHIDAQVWSGGMAWYIYRTTWPFIHQARQTWKDRCRSPTAYPTPHQQNTKALHCFLPQAAAAAAATSTAKDQLAGDGYDDEQEAAADPRQLRHDRLGGVRPGGCQGDGPRQHGGRRHGVLRPVQGRRPGPLRLPALRCVGPIDPSVRHLLTTSTIISMDPSSNASKQ